MTMTAEPRAFALDCPSWVTHEPLKAWVAEIAQLTQPDQIHWCDGSVAENEGLLQQMVASGTLRRLNPAKRPNSYLALSDPTDVARVEDRTFICSQRKQDAGPTNNWVDPREMRTTMRRVFNGAMRGRTMYVVPFSMGPLGSSLAHIGVELTDSPYVVVSMRIMTRMGRAALEPLKDDEFIPCVHSVGQPLAAGQKDTAWPSNKEEKYIVHFPDERSIWSYGSGYGGNALLGKKCLALRIASVMARDEGWMAEHMLILGLKSPDGEKRYVAAGFPSACGKTNLAMLVPPAGCEGWTVTTVGDDIAWIRPGPDGRLHAINPEAGFFGVAPGTSVSLEPHRDGHHPWQYDLHQRGPYTGWRRVVGGDDRRTPRPAHRLAGTAVGAGLRPQGCPPQRPIHCSGSTMSFDGSGLGEPRGGADQRLHLRWPTCDAGTARSPGGELELRRLHSGHDRLGNHGRGHRCDRPGPARSHVACCRSAVTTWATTSITGCRSAARFTDPPRIFCVNWFRKDANGEFIWPGYSQNLRVLKWIFNRVRGRAGATESPLGWMPRYEDLDWKGMETFKPETFRDLMSVPREAWKTEVLSHQELFERLYDRIPKEFILMRELVLSSLWRSAEEWKLAHETDAD